MNHECQYELDFMFSEVLQCTKEKEPFTSSDTVILSLFGISSRRNPYIWEGSVLRHFCSGRSKLFVSNRKYISLMKDNKFRDAVCQYWGLSCLLTKDEIEKCSSEDELESLALSFVERVFNDPLLNDNLVIRNIEFRDAIIVEGYNEIFIGIRPWVMIRKFREGETFLPMEEEKTLVHESDRKKYNQYVQQLP